MLSLDQPGLLTRREVECLALVGLGLQSKEIAPILGIESGTVDVTLKRAGRKVGMGDRRRLARLLKQHQPELIQSTIQRLGQGQISLVPSLSPSPDGLTELGVEGEPERRARWPVPTPEQPWNSLSSWQRRIWAVAIAVGALAAAALLVGLSRHVLRATPQPVDLNLQG